jgi:hypothetical protein
MLTYFWRFFCSLRQNCIPPVIGLLGLALGPIALVATQDFGSLDAQSTLCGSEKVHDNVHEALVSSDNRRPHYFICDLFDFFQLCSDDVF